MYIETSTSAILIEIVAYRFLWKKKTVRVEIYQKFAAEMRVL